MDNTGAMKQKLKYLPPVPIQMVDEDQEEDDECTASTGQNHNHSNFHSHGGSTNQKSLNAWASDVRIGDCTIVRGSGSQKFAVWSITIQTSKGGHIHLLKRYSEFDQLRSELVRAFPDHVNEIPKLPQKKVFGNLNNEFLVKRRRGLEFFISCVMLNPVLANSDMVKRFASESSK